MRIRAAIVLAVCGGVACARVPPPQPSPAGGGGGPGTAGAPASAPALASAPASALASGSASEPPVSVPAKKNPRFAVDPKSVKPFCFGPLVGKCAGRCGNFGEEVERLRSGPIRHKFTETGICGDQQFLRYGERGFYSTTEFFDDGGRLTGWLEYTDACDPVCGCAKAWGQIPSCEAEVREPIVPPPAAGEAKIVAIASGGTCAFAIDDKPQGSGTNVTVIVTPGRHVVTCTPPAGSAASRTVVAESGRPAMVLFKLSP